MHQILGHHIKNKVILYGHSDGGSIALIYTALYPKNVQAIITEAAHVFVEDITLSGIREAVDAFNSGKLIGLQKYHGNQYQAVFWAWADIWLDEAFRNWNITDLLPDITVPQLIIQGRNDQYGSLEQVNAIQSLAQGVTTVLIPECGHSPFKENQKFILKETSTFIKNTIYETSDHRH